MDLGANGLRFKREKNELDTADVSGKSVVFDGDWGKAKISEAEYRKTFESHRRTVHADAAGAGRRAQEALVAGAHSANVTRHKKGSPSGLLFLCTGRR